MKDISVRHDSVQPRPEPAHTAIRKATGIWLALIILSVAGACFGEVKALTEEILLATLIILVVKAQLIVDYFMGIKQVRPLWRLTMSGFAISISFIVWLVY
ncbi:cytochrome C oxidase subunit IV family protein [Aliikangiella sp. G2MR2-5]|uniref:cytochrome C oxidase subunit IV family protein n=1 Tax=Aliikangiella sp. G2MR2-5 TaxID=2788943 RepID=UPI0018AA1A55|nr:cytochrome C oxidase subunit IV family protein [Aliikangiella sp. G2MR2-5]